MIWKVNSVNETAVDLSWDAYKTSKTYKVTVDEKTHSEEVSGNNVVVASFNMWKTW